MQGQRNKDVPLLVLGPAFRILCKGPNGERCDEDEELSR
jgi:hypothetical protein